MHRALATLLMILVMVATNDARAQIETLVMPGELIAGHAELEATCGNCHKAFDRGRQRELCLDCHDDVAENDASFPFCTSAGIGFRLLAVSCVYF